MQPAREIGTDSNFKAAVAAVGKAITLFALARLEELKEESLARDEEVRFDPDDGEKAWQTFDNAIADKPETKKAAPITVAPETKAAVAAVLMRAADTAARGENGPLNYEELCDRVPALKIMARIVAVMGPRLCRDPLCRDLSLGALFKTRYEALFPADRAGAAPTAERVARVLVDFLRAVGWAAATQAYEVPRLPLSGKAYCAILAMFEICDPGARDLAIAARSDAARWKMLTKAAAASKKK